MAIKVFFVPLGCAKNLVNAEQMVARLKGTGMEMVEAPQGADVAVVNTCGFIEPAQQEAIDTILSLAQIKAAGELRAIVVSGCLSERYHEQFMDELPEVDAILGTGSYGDIVEAVLAVLDGKKGKWLKNKAESELTGERALLTPKYSAYLRIAEGCDNRCAFCVIPDLRGPYRSVPIEQLVAEAEWLAGQGCKELLVVAQDITRYGIDLYGRRRLSDLLRALAGIPGIQWIRLHYLYPDEVDRELLETIANTEKILKYIEMPIQHIDDRILRRMNRRGDSQLIRELIDEVRRMMPDAVIRTTLIVGFPGEGEEEFETLCRFLAEYRLDRAGVFCYSQEEGSAAAALPDQVPEAVKEDRRARIYELQTRIMEEKAASYPGRVFDVLTCGTDEEGNRYGRTYMDSPDIDGVVYFTADLPEGEIVPMRVTHADPFDLYAEPV